MRKFNTLTFRGPWWNRKLTVLGGSYRDRPKGTFGVCMAKELLENKRLKLTADVAIPVVDFSNPEPDTLLDGALEALTAALNRQTVYVGCGFGIGRTGTMLAAMVRISQGCSGRQAIEFVRANYLKTAVETSAQEELIENLAVWHHRSTHLHNLARRQIFFKAL